MTANLEHLVQFHNSIRWILFFPFYMEEFPINLFSVCNKTEDQDEDDDASSISCENARLEVIRSCPNKREGQGK